LSIGHSAEREERAGKEVVGAFLNELFRRRKLDTVGAVFSPEKWYGFRRKIPRRT